MDRLTPQRGTMSYEQPNPNEFVESTTGTSSLTTEQLIAGLEVALVCTALAVVIAQQEATLATERAENARLRKALAGAKGPMTDYEALADRLHDTFKSLEDEYPYE